MQLECNIGNIKESSTKKCNFKIKLIDFSVKTHCMVNKGNVGRYRSKKCMY